MDVPKFPTLSLNRILLLLTTLSLFQTALAAESSLNFNSSTPASLNNTDTTGNDILTRFQEATGRVNAAILAYPRKNNYIYKPSAKAGQAATPAPFLDVDSILGGNNEANTANQTTAAIGNGPTKRTVPIWTWKRFLTTNHSSSSQSTSELSPSLARSYTIPPEIRAAAKLAAESSPQAKTKTLAFGGGEDDYDGIVQSMLKTSFTSNDTNAMSQALRGEDGLGVAYENSRGPNPMDAVSSGGGGGGGKILEGREGSAFWVEEMAGREAGGGGFQVGLGFAPFCLLDFVLLLSSFAFFGVSGRSNR